MGCHSDSGFEHQARGFYAQMIVGASFNSTGFPKNGDGAFARSPGWNLRLSDPSVSFAATTEPTALFHGVASEKLTLTGKGNGGVSNRGLSNAGMVYQGGKSYDGFIFARLPAGSAAAPVVVHVSLEDFVSNKTLATQTLSVGGGGSSGAAAADFVRYNFTLTPSTGCVKKRHFCAILYIKCIVLPRQARDIHRENSNKEWRFLRLISLPAPIRRLPALSRGASPVS